MPTRFTSLALLLIAVGCGPTSTPGADAGLDAGLDGGGSDGGAADAGTRLPSGVTLAVPVPSGTSPGTFGNDLAMALDAAGDPMLSYSWTSPGGVTADGAVFFTRWDAKTAAWTTPVKVETVGPIFSNVPLRHTALAFDASTGTIAIAYGRFNTRSTPGNQLIYSTHLAISTDGGKTFTSETVSERMNAGSGAEEAYLPTLRLHQGTTHLAYFQRWQRCSSGSGSECHAAWYVTRSGNSGAFTRTLAPLTAGTAGNRTLPLSLALDSAGKPALAYLVGEGTGNNTTLLYWRPGEAAAVKVFDSAGTQNDVASVALAFDGTGPRVVAKLFEAPAPAADLRFASSEDGTTWTTVAVPRDGGQTTQAYVALSIFGGKTVVAMDNNGGSAPGTCGAPKLSRSTDLSTWTTCGLDKAVIDSAAGRYLNLAHGPDGKLVMAFHYQVTTNAMVGPGIVVHREP